MSLSDSENAYRYPQDPTGTPGTGYQSGSARVGPLEGSQPLAQVAAPNQDRGTGRGTGCEACSHWHDEAFDDHHHDRDDFDVQEMVRQDGRWHHHELAGVSG